jgi:hypothetical protein
MNKPKRNKVEYLMMKQVNTMQQNKLSAVKKTEIWKCLVTDKNSVTITYVLKKPNLQGINFIPME